jgi:hypothetical protein
MSGFAHDGDDDPTAERPALAHVPVRPDRSGTAGEIAFLSAWQALMEATQAAPLDHETLDGRVPADQRGATVAASIVQWLGTNGGACLIQEGRRLMEAGLPGPDAFHAAWAIRNVRQGHVNHGLRSIEWILLPPGCVMGWSDPQPQGMPELTVADLDMAEHVARWLGSAAGLAFVAVREAEIDACRAMQDSRNRESIRSGRPRQVDMAPSEIADFLRLLRAAEARGAAA